MLDDTFFHKKRDGSTFVKIQRHFLPLSTTVSTSKKSKQATAMNISTQQPVFQYIVTKKINRRFFSSILQEQQSFYYTILPFFTISDIKMAAGSICGIDCIEKRNDDGQGIIDCFNEVKRWN